MNAHGKRAINNKTLTNCNGVRKVVLDRQRHEAQLRKKNMEDEMNHVKVPISSNLIDRLMKNIIKRSN